MSFFKVYTGLNTANAIADPGSVRRGTGRQVAFDAWSDKYRIGTFIVTTTAQANVNAVTIAVAALLGEIPNGAILYFAAGKFARLTQRAYTGDLLLHVEALAAQINNASTAYAIGDGPKTIPPFVACADDGNGKLIPRDGTHAAVCLLMTGAQEKNSGGYNGDDTAALTGYGTLLGGVVYEELLPDAVAGALDDTIKDELTAAGCYFTYETYSDSILSGPDVYEAPYPYQ